MRMKHSLAIVALLSVTGCETIGGWFGGGELTADKSIAVSCEAYASALRALTPVKASLSITQVAIVNEVVAIAEPTCLAWVDTGSVKDTAIAAVTAAVSRLLDVKIAKLGRA